MHTSSSKYATACTVSEMERHCSSFVKHQLFSGQTLPSRLNRRYYPSRRDLINIMYRTRVADLHSSVDQENLRAKMLEWSADEQNMFYFRPYVDNVASSDVDGDECVMGSRGESGLLLVHQTTWQQRLLQRYGNMCLLDATYKTTRYAVPLFFLCVRTNVDYAVVATFVTQYEDNESIAEALQVIAGWNASWTPQDFMVDFCEAEILALEQTFPGTVLAHFCISVYSLSSSSCHHGDRVHEQKNDL